MRSDSAAAHGISLRATVVPPHRDGGQAQFIKIPVPEPRSPSTWRARAWALENLHLRFTLKDLADKEAMSVRTFTRRFRAEVGVPPGQWLLQQRLQRARQLLEETDLPVEQVAALAAYLASDDAAQINGTLISIDGGWTAG